MQPIFFLFSTLLVVFSVQVTKRECSIHIARVVHSLNPLYGCTENLLRISY